MGRRCLVRVSDVRRTSDSISAFNASQAHASKPGFQKPWLLREFDQIQFYEVDQAEFDKCYEDFKTGRFVFEVEETKFDPLAYKQFLDSIASETREFVKRRNAAGKLCGQEENRLLKDWRAEQASREEVEGMEDEIAGGG
jgi:urea carboxylase